MNLYATVLAAAVFTTGLSAGVFFTFTALVVPGLGDADARTSLKGFQTIDRRLQPTSPSRDWQPVFGLVIFGSMLLVVAALVAGFAQPSGLVRLLLATAALVHNLCFWIPTFAVIVPFNNRVRDDDLDRAPEALVVRRRAELERAWARWNLIRTAGSALSFALLIAAALIP